MHVSFGVARKVHIDWSRPIRFEPPAIEVRVPGTPRPEADDLRRRFLDLASSWRKDIITLSSSTARMRHPSCRGIVAMGEPVVPLILAELEREAWHWGGLLAEITRESPVQPSEAGDLEKVRRAWLQWGRDRGLLG